MMFTEVQSSRMPRDCCYFPSGGWTCPIFPLSFIKEQKKWLCR